MPTVKGIFLSSDREVLVTITGPDKETIDAVYDTIDDKHEYRGSKILPDNLVLINSLISSLELVKQEEISRVSP